MFKKNVKHLLFANDTIAISNTTFLPLIMITANICYDVQKPFNTFYTQTKIYKCMQSLLRVKIYNILYFTMRDYNDQLLGLFSKRHLAG